MVQHVDRIHKIIERVLTELRAQTHMQVQIEANFLQFTDNFMKDVGVQWSNLPSFSFGSNTTPLGGSIPAGRIERTSTMGYPLRTAESLSIFRMAVAFLNSAETTMVIHAAKSSTTRSSSPRPT